MSGLSKGEANMTSRLARRKDAAGAAATYRPSAVSGAPDSRASASRASLTSWR